MPRTKTKKRNKKPSLNQLTKLVDELGVLKAEQDNLELRITFIKATLDQCGVEQLSGKLFRATVSRFDKPYTDWKAMMEFFRTQVDPTDYAEALEANTTKKPQVRVSVTSR